MKKVAIAVSPSVKYGIQHASIRMYFNGVLCAFTFAESSKYFCSEGETREAKYQIWDTYSMMTSERDGMKDVLRINADEVFIISNIGCYRIRPLREGDVKKYGVNNWKGLFAEPVYHVDVISELEAENVIPYFEQY